MTLLLAYGTIAAITLAIWVIIPLASLNLNCIKSTYSDRVWWGSVGWLAMWWPITLYLAIREADKKFGIF